MRIGPARVEGGRNFATKLWNTSRFCEMNGCVSVPGFEPQGVTETVNKWIVTETAGAITELTGQLEAFRFNDAAATAFHFVYDIFCDWYVEITKPIFQMGSEAAKAETRATTAWARDQILKLLHPFMPFITEELWALTSETPRDRLLILSDWPELVRIPGAVAAAAENELAHRAHQGRPFGALGNECSGGCEDSAGSGGSRRRRKGPPGTQPRCDPDPGTADVGR